MDTLTRQKQLEEKMVSMGVERYRREIAKAKEKGRESETPASVALMSKAVEPLSDALYTYISEAMKGNGGKNNLAAKQLKRLDPEVVAFITLKTLMDALSYKATVQKVATAIGASINHEINIQMLKDKEPKLFATVYKDLKKKTKHSKHQYAVYRNQATKARVVMEDWSATERFKVGNKALDLAIATTGWFKLYKRHKCLIEIQASDELKQFIMDKNARCELLSPVLLPLVHKPKRWSNLHNGGYYTKAIKMDMLKTLNKDYKRDANKLDMPEIYDTVNSLQEVPYRINKKVFDVLDLYLQVGNGAAGLPSAEEAPLPIKPNDIDTNKESLTKWKRKAAKVYKKNSARASKYLSTILTMQTAEQFLNEERFFYTWYLDFRSRLYPAQKYLTPQSADISKALLELADGVDIVDEEQLAWLNIVGANHYGFDKAPLQERANWIEERSELIIATAEDPYANKWWMDADKPWQFLSFCFEYAECSKTDLPFTSHLIGAVDATCSGIQHFSAMLLDESGAEAVNITPNEIRQDIYQRVADLMKQKINHTPTAELVKWLNFIDRSLIKQNVMTMPYSATLLGMRDQISSKIKELEEKGKPLPEIENVNDDAKFLSKLSSECIDEIVVGARVVMTWLQDCAKVSAKAGLPISWTTPVGFTVLQDYQKKNVKTVKSILQGEVKKYSFIDDSVKGKLIKQKQASGIAPNFVHSADSAMLIRTITKCSKEGIQIVPVHDSFGTHVAHLPRLNRLLREAFLDIHLHNDMLKDFRERLIESLPEEFKDKVPPLPKRGNLDLTVVLESDYFFS